MARTARIVTLLIAFAAFSAPSAHAHIFKCRWHHHCNCCVSTASTSGTTTTTSGTPSVVVKEVDKNGPAIDELKNRVAAVEDKLSGIENRLATKLSKVEEAISTLSERHEQSTNSLEQRIDESLNLTKSNAELILANTREIQRLVRLTSLAPGHQVTATATDEQRRLFAALVDIQTPPSDLKKLDKGTRVRIVQKDAHTENGVKYSKIRYVDDASGDLSDERFVDSAALESLYTP